MARSREGVRLGWGPWSCRERPHQEGRGGQLRGRRGGGGDPSGHPRRAFQAKPAPPAGGAAQRGAAGGTGQLGEHGGDLGLLSEAGGGVGSHEGLGVEAAAQEEQGREAGSSPPP